MVNTDVTDTETRDKYHYLFKAAEELEIGIAILIENKDYNNFETNEKGEYYD